MFPRFRQSQHRLQVSIVQNRRIDGVVKHEHIASLGSIATPPSVADRVAFWQRLHERLAKLSNRVGAEDQGKILTAVHARIPMPTINDQRALQLENAKADAGFWAGLRDMHASTVQDHKGLIATAERAVAAGEAEAAKADAKAKASQECIERIEKGEDVSGGLGKPMTREDFNAILRSAGFTKQDFRRIEAIGKINERPGGMEFLVAETLRRTLRAHDAAARDVLKMIEGLEGLDDEAFERVMVKLGTPD